MDKQCSSCGGFCGEVCERENVKSDLLNQTCCGCGRSAGYALYCGWCWSEFDKPVADVSMSGERVPNPDKQRQWVGLTPEQRNNIMQEHGKDWKRYTEAVERQIQENNS
ncbi:MAG: hypothetical protein R6T98_15365 [Desulfatiglandales bacterium]